MHFVVTVRRAPLGRVMGLRRSGGERHLRRVEDDRIATIRYHFFSPDVVADVCGELGLSRRSNGYRYWPSATAQD